MNTTEEYRLRWAQAARTNDPQGLGKILTEIWDRLVMYEDEPETRLLIAGVGAEFVAAMKTSCDRARQSLPEKFEALGAVFVAVASGRVVEYELRSGSGKRTVVFVAGTRTVLMRDGSTPAAN